MQIRSFPHTICILLTRNGPEFFGPLMDSPSRIHAAMRLYFDAFYHPDRIFFNSILWDLQLLRQVQQFLSSLSLHHSYLSLINVSSSTYVNTTTTPTII